MRKDDDGASRLFLGVVRLAAAVFHMVDIDGIEYQIPCLAQRIIVLACDVTIYLNIGCIFLYLFNARFEIRYLLYQS